MVDRLAQIRQEFGFKFASVALSMVMACTPGRDGRSPVNTGCIITPNTSSEDMWREVNPQTGEEAYVVEGGGAVTYPEGIIRNDSQGVTVRIFRERLHTLLTNPTFEINIPHDVMVVSLLIPRSSRDPEAVINTTRFLQESREQILQGFEANEGKKPGKPVGVTVSLEDIFRRFFVEDRQSFEDLPDLSRRLSLEWLISTHAAFSGRMLGINEEGKEFIKKTPPLEILTIDTCILQRFGVIRGV